MRKLPPIRSSLSRPRLLLALVFCLAGVSLAVDQFPADENPLPAPRLATLTHHLCATRRSSAQSRGWRERARSGRGCRPPSASAIRSSAGSAASVSSKIFGSILPTRTAFTPARPAARARTRAGSGVRSMAAAPSSGFRTRPPSKAKSRLATAAATPSWQSMRWAAFISTISPWRISAPRVRTISALTFTCSNTGVPDTAVDRQWYAIDGDPLNGGSIYLTNDEIGPGGAMCGSSAGNNVLVMYRSPVTGLGATAGLAFGPAEQNHGGRQLRRGDHGQQRSQPGRNHARPAERPRRLRDVADAGETRFRHPRQRGAEQDSHRPLFPGRLRRADRRM